MLLCERVAASQLAFGTILGVFIDTNGWRSRLAGWAGECGGNRAFAMLEPKYPFPIYVSLRANRVLLRKDQCLASVSRVYNHLAQAQLTRQVSSWQSDRRLARKGG